MKRRSLLFALLTVFVVFAAQFASAQIPNPAEFNRTFTQRNATVNGVRLHYLQGGRGEPVVLLHGFPETSYAWRKIMPALAQRYTVIAPDLPGLGDSSKSDKGYDKKTVAEDIYQLVRKLGFRQISLVGHDWGGNVAYAYAAAHRDSVQKLAILEAAFPGPGSYAEQLDNRQGKGLWFPVFHMVPDLPEALVAGREKLYLDWFFDHLSYTPAAITRTDRDQYVRAYSLPGAMRAGFGYYRTVLNEDTRQVTEDAKVKLKMPVLAVGGAASIGAGVAHDMRILAENVQGDVLNRCGHWILDECSGAITPKLLSFLSEAATQSVNRADNIAEQSRTVDMMQVAQQGFEQFSQGAATGNWAPFIALLTDDVTVRFPLPEPRRGSKVGKEEAVATFRYIAEVQKVRAKLTLTKPPTVNANTVAFEVISEGAIQNNPIKTPFAVVFDIRENRIAGVREYIGDRGV